MSILTSNLASIRVMEASDLSMVLEWRNHRDVREFMYTQHKISVLEHAEWFDRVSKDESRCCFIFEYDGTPMGFVSFNIRAGGQSADWGFYVSPLSKKGMGTMLGKSALSYAFTYLRLYEIYGEALSNNVRSIAFHKKLGFKNNGMNLKSFKDGTQPYTIVCFSLTAEDWKKSI